MGGAGRKEQGDGRGLIYRTIEWQQQNSSRYNDVSRLVNVMLKYCEEIPKVQKYTSKLQVRLDSKFLSYLEAPLRKKNQKYKGLNIEQCKERCVFVASHTHKNLQKLLQGSYCYYCMNESC